MGKGSQIIASGRRVRYVLESICPSSFLTIQTFLDTENYTSQMYAEYEIHDTKAGLDPHEGFVNRFVTLFSAKQACTPKKNHVTCDSRDREYDTFLNCFFHDRFSRYKSYEFQELRYQHAPSSKNTRQKLPSSNFGFTSCFSNPKTFFLIFDTFLGF